MSYGKIINLANKLVAAYKEVPYSALKVFLAEKTAQFPHDRVLQHVGAIIEKRAEQYPFGSMYVKDLDALIGELSSFGSTEFTRRIFSAYLDTVESDEGRSISKEVFTEDNRDLSEIKRQASRREDTHTPERIGDVPANKIMPDYKISKSYDRKTIADGANIVNRAVRAAFGAVPSSVTFEADSDRGIIYSATVVSSGGRVDIKVPLEKGTFGFHAPDSFIADVDGKPVKYLLNERTASSFMETKQSEKSPTYDANFVNASYKELHAALLSRASERDYRGAEEAISLIQQKYPTMSKAALDDYQSVLMLFAKAESKHTCLSCPFYEPSGEKTASVRDYCNKLRKPVREIVKSADHNCTLVSNEAKKTIAGFVGRISSHNIRMS